MKRRIEFGLSSMGKTLRRSFREKTSAKKRKDEFSNCNWIELIETKFGHRVIEKITINRQTTLLFFPRLNPWQKKTQKVANSSFLFMDIRKMPWLRVSPSILLACFSCSHDPGIDIIDFRGTWPNCQSLRRHHPGHRNPGSYSVHLHSRAPAEVSAVVQASI